MSHRYTFCRDCDVAIRDFNRDGVWRSKLGDINCDRGGFHVPVDFAIDEAGA